MTGPDRAADREMPPYSPLPGSFKNRFAFRLAAPSFIYPDGIVPNVRMLAPVVDEIELLLFESTPADRLPTQEEIGQLCVLAGNDDVTYNVHLPLDVNLTDADAEKRDDAVSRISKAVKRARPLSPSTWTLHLPYAEAAGDAASVSRWQARCAHATEKLLGAADLVPRSVSVETLSYPPAWLEPVVDALGLSVCVDIGHLVEHGYDICRTFGRFEPRVSILHLYGGSVAGRGHVSLDRLPQEHVPAVSRIVARFSGIVSLEVFSRRDLDASLTALARLAESGRPLVCR